MPYGNISRSTQTGTEPGYKDTVYFADIADITTWSRPTDTPTVLGDKYKITTAHTFAASKGAYSIECKMRSPVGTAEQQGDPGEATTNHTLVFEVNGDSPELLELLETMSNGNLVFWVKDSDCLNNDSYVQYGDDCLTCDVRYQFNSRKSNETGKKVYTVTVTVPKKKYFYQAALTIL